MALHKLGAALIVVFAVTLVALLAEIFCVLRRRRRFRRQNLAGNSFYSPSTKELLYFFCWKNQSRIEPQGTPPPPPPPPPPLPNASPPPQSDETTEADDVFKWQELYGSSRLLFTIKEEDREGVDSENCSSSEKAVSTMKEKRAGVDTKSFQAAVMIEVVDEEATTPFSTPCASPPYYTPLASPDRGESDMVPFVSIVM